MTEEDRAALRAKTIAQIKESSWWADRWAYYASLIRGHGVPFSTALNDAGAIMEYVMLAEKKADELMRDHARHQALGRDLVDAIMSSAPGEKES